MKKKRLFALLIVVCFLFVGLAAGLIAQAVGAGRNDLGDVTITKTV